MSLNISELQ
ncbi:Protein of unknown function [Bacillus toyonensis]|nr:Protein of unknown function [Bacillus toyonensis]